MRATHAIEFRARSRRLGMFYFMSSHSGTGVHSHHVSSKRRRRVESPIHSTPTLVQHGCPQTITHAKSSAPQSCSCPVSAHYHLIVQKNPETGSLMLIPKSLLTKFVERNTSVSSLNGRSRLATLWSDFPLRWLSCCRFEQTHQPKRHALWRQPGRPSLPPPSTSCASAV